MAAVEELLREYRATGAESVKHQVMISCLPLVKYLAGRLMVRMPSVIEQEDLESYGLFGLLEAVEKYNPDLGVSFKTYAHNRIRGSMIDEVRKMSWIPRSVLQKVQKLSAAKEELQRIHGGDVNDEMLAQALGLEMPDYYKLILNTGQMYLASLDESAMTHEGEQLSLVDFISDPDSPDPLTVIEDKESREILAQCISELPEKDQLILSLYYHEKLTLKEISKILTVSESRVCQLHTRAIGRLRKSMNVEADIKKPTSRKSKKDGVSTVTKITGDSQTDTSKIEKGVVLGC
ncbi:MAG: FliA/WhiG family RNA polymerase sigma factor [Peptococcaceae bacterium]|nr:FliA/WhiG family RNA polymerase sigma factor [Peptococcaceae bacterium]